MTREDRYFKRKDEREKINEDDRLAREKKYGKARFGNKDRDVRKVRKLKDGGIAFGNKAKIGRTGLIVMPTFLAIILFVWAGAVGWFDDYLPEVENSAFVSIPFEECEAMNFDDPLCVLDYKFCRTYADGTALCEFAPENPFVSVDVNENKYSPEEQDFLPPGFTLFQYAEARSEDEPTCYSTACEKAMGSTNSTSTSSSSSEDEGEIVCYSSACKVAMADRIREQEAAKEKESITTASGALVNPIGFNTIGIMLSNSCQASISVGGDCISYRDLVVLYDNTNESISGRFVEDERNGDVRRTSPVMQKHWHYYRNAGMPTIVAVDPDMTWYRDHMDVRIIIEPPTGFVYFDKEKDLNLDTTNPYYSEYVVVVPETDEEDDSIPPEDVCFTSACKKMISELNAIANAEKLKEEREAELEEEKQKAEEAIRKGHLVTYKDVYIEGCAFARVSSNPYLVTEVINYFINNCDDSSDWSFDEQTVITPVPSIPVDPKDYSWYKYNAWLNQKMQECKTKC